MESLNGCDEPIYNTVRTSFWKKKVAACNLNDDEFAIPLFVYYDDFEPLNALGSHSSAYKLGGVYVNIPCIPPHVQAQLQFIFLAMLFFTSDSAVYGNGKVFAPLIQQLNKLLTEGVPIVHETYKRVKFISVLLIGDNLGLNSMMSFSAGFNAYYFCRFCRNPKLNTKKVVTEDTEMLRTVENYKADCNRKSFKSTGIKENSVWNDLLQFHVANNRSADTLHDFLEGLLKLVVLQLLKKLIFVRNYFSIATFNKRRNNMTFASTFARWNRIRILVY